MSITAPLISSNIWNMNVIFLNNKIYYFILINFRDTPFFDISNFYDCESIKERLHEFYESEKYGIDYRDELKEKIGILRQRLFELGCAE